jgi:hypothetical protein
MTRWRDRSPTYVSAGRLSVTLVFLSFLASPITASIGKSASSQDAANLIQLPILGPGPPDLGLNAPIPTAHQFVGFPFQDASPLVP